jgi:peroxiredoxin Q/BCP
MAGRRAGARGGSPKGTTDKKSTAAAGARKAAATKPGATKRGATEHRAMGANEARNRKATTSATAASAKRAGESSAQTAKRTLLRPGEPAPDFRLPSSEGREIALSEFRGKHVVVYFYPRDDTPGCTREARAFRDAAEEFRRRDAVVLGISKDSVESHCRFRDKHGLTFPLLSDPDGSVIERWGAWGEKSMYGKKSMGIIRSTVVVDPEGNVKKVFPNVKVDGHVSEVLAAIDGA